MKLNAGKVENQYRPVPFWSLNDKLNVEETRRQVRLMHEAGLGGFFLHARGGLQTPYMEQEWFDNIEAAIKEAELCGMEAWAYDENGWPSGFGAGTVNGLGEAYQQKYLRREPGEKHTPHTIANIGGFHYYYEVNPFYVDLLDEKVTKEFIKRAYEPYYRRFGNRLTGFFTDEPQLSRDGYPWSLTLPEAYRTEYGEELIPLLPQMFAPEGDYKQTRLRFWRLVTRRFTESYTKQIYEWCRARGLKFTGHMLLEETLSSQILCNGAVMPHYEYFDMPGVDKLGRLPDYGVTALQVGSVAHQMGKQQVLTESFAMSGHSVGFEVLKGQIEWQMVRGVTRVCPHLQGYSLRGIRKRDYPPAMYYQQPWWKQYGTLVEALSRTGKLLSEGTALFDTLLIHPQSTAWVCYDDGENRGLADYDKAFLETVEQLERKHICFHLGDETMMERHARVEGRTLVLGTQRYTRIVLPPHEVLFDNTKRLLEEFRKGGGEIRTAEQIPANDMVDNPAILFTQRQCSNGMLYFFVNPGDTEETAYIAHGSCRIDPVTGESTPFDGCYTFRPYESLLVFDNGVTHTALRRPDKADALSLGGEWTVVAHSENALVLDYCDYSFDGRPIEKKGYILNIQERACAEGRPITVQMTFRFRVETVPKEVWLLCETPEKYSLTLNGRPLSNHDGGWLFDTAFRKLDVSGRLREGENVLEAQIVFVQPDGFYEQLEKARQFESEKNKLTYATEIEAFYLVGDFGVKTPRKKEDLPEDTVRYTGEFVLTAPPKTVKLAQLQEQGYPFFAGTLTVRRNFLGNAGLSPVVRFRKHNVNAVKVKVNGTVEGTCLWEPLELPLSAWQTGENMVELTLVNNLRNLLGPHHNDVPDEYRVCPESFFKEDTVFGESKAFNEGYLLARYGLESCE